MDTIQVRDLEFAWGEGDFRLTIPSLGIARGETLALIGHRGSGKTPLLHLLAGILVPRTGDVVADGVELSALGDVERRAFRVARVGLVFQEFELLDYLSVLDNVLLPYRIHPCMRLTGEVRARAVALARRMGLGDRLGRRPRHLSQGERQRAAVCRALLPEPPILLADEPTGNLDPANKTRVLDLLFEEVAARGTTLVAVTHDHALLGRFDRQIDFERFAPPRAAT
jgi:ABC-type lipoprotein export system ATPase subunit